MKEFGLQLTPAREEDLAHLEEIRRTIGAAWEERKQKLNQALQSQIFKEQADQAENWLASKEAFLNNEDLGVSIQSIFSFLYCIHLFRRHAGGPKKANFRECKIIR